MFDILLLQPLMRPRYRLLREQRIARPVDEVFAFFVDAGNLERLTPAFLHFRILSPPPIRIQAGTTIAYRLRLWRVAFNWVTRIVVFEPERRFVDQQIAGPYRLWRHLHEFWPLAGGTLMRDVVEYELPYGPLGVLAHGVLVGRTLDRIFDYRRAQVAAIFKPLDEKESGRETQPE